MPLGRYFLYVGGALLALLLVLNAYLPSLEAASATATEYSRPVLRIRSAQKLPERIVIDTSIPTIVPAPTVVAEAKPPAKIPALDALAQISPSDLKSADLKSADLKSADLKKADLKKPEPKAPPKRRVAKRTVRQPMVAFAQAPPRFDFDLFAHN
jgi:hypothetical protein